VNILETFLLAAIAVMMIRSGIEKMIAVH